LVMLSWGGRLYVSVAARPTQTDLNNSAQDGNDWLYADHDYFGQRYSTLNEIDTKNVDHLTQVCNYTFPEKEPSQTAPIVYQGVLYATTAHHTVALNGATCEVIWQS